MILEGHFRAFGQNLPTPLADIRPDETDAEPFARVVEVCGSLRFLVPIDQNSFDLSWIAVATAGDDFLARFEACCTSKEEIIEWRDT